MDKDNKILNVYGQEVWHDDVLLMGNKESLTELRRVIDEALEKGKGSVRVKATDKDGYRIVVKTVEGEDILTRAELPYKMVEFTEEGNNNRDLSKRELIGD